MSLKTRYFDRLTEFFIFWVGLMRLIYTKDLSPLFGASSQQQVPTGTFKGHSRSAYQKGHMRKEPEMYLTSLGRKSQLGTISCSTERRITGHFLELGWGPAVLRSSERDRNG